MYKDVHYSTGTTILCLHVLICELNDNVLTNKNNSGDINMDLLIFHNVYNFIH